MVRGLLVRGMLAGLAAAALALIVGWIFGEPEVEAAINVEAHHAEEDEVVSRDVQKTLGLATGLAMYGVAIGGMFALVFAFAWGRLGGLGARPLSALLALGAFVVVTLVPFVKYPANPPAVGHAESIERRTALYLTLIAITLLVAIGGLWLGRRLAPVLGAWNATLAGAVAFVLVIGVIAALMPSVDEVGHDFPATVLWRFRLASLGVQATMWATLGLLFAPLAERVLGAGQPSERTGVT